MAFPGRIAYCKNEGYRTAGIAEPFRLLEALNKGEYDVVGPEVARQKYHILFEALKASNLLDSVCVDRDLLGVSDNG